MYSVENCINKSYVEKLGEAIVDFSHMNYLRKEEIGALEILIKIFLSLINILIALVGNSYVIYSILIKPYRMGRNRTNESNILINNSNRIDNMVSLTHFYKNRLKSNGNVLGMGEVYECGEDSCSLYSKNLVNLNFNKKNAIVRDFNLNDSDFNKIDLLADHEILTNNGAANENARNEKKFIVTRIYKPYKNKPVNLFILNLCVCDLMIVFWCSWVHMINAISENWTMGAFFCRFNTYVQGKAF